MAVNNNKSVNKTFTLDNATVEKLSELAEINHLSRSAFLRFIIWDYEEKKLTYMKQGEENQ